MNPARKLLLVGASALALVLFPAAELRAQVPQGPAGEAFYSPPSPLPSGARGSVIYVRPLDGTMALPSAATNTLVLYRSLSDKGAIVPVSGTVAIPRGKAPEGGWPVITWTHGTTGLAAICAPSRDTANGPEHDYIKTIQGLLDAFVREGYAVVASDYQGLGVAGDHPFLQGVPTGRNALDMLTAARALSPEIGTRYAVMGHSQGGQVDLFAAAQGPDYVPSLQLVGNVAFAPASQIADRLKLVTTSDKVELSLPYLLYVLQSFARTDPAIDLARILTPQAMAHLPDLMQGCMTHALTTGYWSKAIAKEQFVASPDFAAFLKFAAKNEPGALKIAAPTMVVQGSADVTVFPAATDGLVRQLCANGNVVDYRVFADADHNGSMTYGGKAAQDWIAARFRGDRARDMCGDLPSAARK